MRAFNTISILVNGVSIIQKTVARMFSRARPQMNFEMHELTEINSNYSGIYSKLFSRTMNFNSKREKLGRQFSLGDPVYSVMLHRKNLNLEFYCHGNLKLQDKLVM